MDTSENSLTRIEQTCGNYRRLSENLATSGQPTVTSLAAVARAGFQVVINLAPATDERALPDEGSVVELLGMAYEHIPVVWVQPTHADLEAFFQAMARHAGKRVWVHCIANMRVSAFVALYRILQLGWPVSDALPDLHAIWQPNPTWQAFIAAELAEHAASARLRVRVAEPLEDEQIAYLRQVLDPSVELITGPRPEPALYEVLVDGEPTRAALAASPGLRAVIIPYTGVSPELRQLMREFPQVTLYNSHHPAQATAEVAFALLLASAKFLIPLDRALRQDDWSLRYGSIPSVLLQGKTVLILGYGAIGQRVARMCRGFDMRVMAGRRLPGLFAGDPVEVHTVGELDSLLPQTDFLVVTLPLTDETRGLIGERELALLPPGAVLVNVGRGPVVDEAALYHALKANRLRAAGLDVWYNYPDDESDSSHTPPSAYPFGALDNAVLSPHRGGLAGEEVARNARMEALAAIINALARGEPAPNQVDLERGY